MKAVWLVSVGAAISLACSAEAHAEAHGRVVGEGYYRNALVCIDINRNARCDRSEPSGHTDGQGRFTIDGGRGPIVAEVVAGSTWLVDPARGAERERQNP